MSARPWPRTLLLTVGALLVGGCAMGPDYQRPTVDLPPDYRFATAQVQRSIAELPYTAVFSDPRLCDLIHIALLNNFDLQQAIARVDQSRQLAIAAGAPLMPSVGYGGTAGRGENAFANQPTPNGEQITNSGAVTVSLAWEIDVWGRIRRLSEAARAQYLATDAARQGVMISLIGSVATAYYQLIGLNRQLEVEKAAVVAFTGTLKIFTEKRDNGVASKLETDRASASLTNAEAQIPSIEMQIATTEDQISILLGENPGPILHGTLADQPPVPALIPAGLPSELLQRRPDVQQSEQLLIASNALIGENLANCFPQIGLTAFFGKVSPQLSAFTGGGANAWSFGANIAGPIFQGGSLRAQYHAAQAAYEAAKAQYVQTVRTALREVSDALVTREKIAEIRVFNQETVDALASSVAIANERYLNGKSSYYEVLEAQQDLYASQQVLVLTQTNEFISQVQIYKALGGGWQATDAAAPAAK